MVTKAEMIVAVRQHATEHYNEDGWDFLVECWEDSDIGEAIDEAVTIEDAIRMAHRAVSLMDEQRAEVVSTIW